MPKPPAPKAGWKRIGRSTLLSRLRPLPQHGTIMSACGQRGKRDKRQTLGRLQPGGLRTGFLPDAGRRRWLAAILTLVTLNLFQGPSRRIEPWSSGTDGC
jgi:hypothetical protein